MSTLFGVTVTVTARFVYMLLAEKKTTNKTVYRVTQIGW